MLSLPLEEITSTDIKTLFTVAEELIQKELVDLGKYKSGYRPSVMFRRVMKYLTAPLKNGALIQDIKFTTKFTERKSNRKVISEMPDSGLGNNEHSAPVSTLEASLLHKNCTTRLLVILMRATKE